MDRTSLTLDEKKERGWLTLQSDSDSADWKTVPLVSSFRIAYILKYGNSFQIN